MATSRPLPTPPGTAPASTPSLPPTVARPSPRLEQRPVEIVLVRAPHRRTSMRSYLLGALALAAISVAGWFALGEYIYG